MNYFCHTSAIKSSYIVFALFPSIKIYKVVARDWTEFENRENLKKTTKKKQIKSKKKEKYFGYKIEGDT